MITTEQVRELFDYKDGNLYWRKRSNSKVEAGKAAGTVNASGYVVITIKGKKIHAHRLIWIWHGRDLPKQIDHINRNPLDNRIENLRAADVRTNAYNMGLKSDNKSGVKNVSWCNTYRKWIVQIYGNGRKVSGRFDNIEDAAAFAKAKRLELHGEYACHGGAQ